MAYPTIGFIGLGIMGKPMARHLLKAGYALVVHNRSRGAVDELSKEGAQVAWLAPAPSNLSAFGGLRLQRFALRSRPARHRVRQLFGGNGFQNWLARPATSLDRVLAG